MIVGWFVLRSWADGKLANSMPFHGIDRGIARRSLGMIGYNLKNIMVSGNWFRGMGDGLFSRSSWPLEYNGDIVEKPWDFGYPFFQTQAIPTAFLCQA